MPFNKDGRLLNRYGTPEVAVQFSDGTFMTVTQAEGYADAVLQRLGLIGDDLGPPDGIRDHHAFMQEKVVPTIFAVLHDAGEIHPVEGVKFAEGGPEVAKMLAIAHCVGSILGWNRAANERFGKGKWSL